jgi:hypothetical protein
VEGTCLNEPSAFAECNLYELHEVGGSWSARLVAVLSGEDGPDFSTGLPQLTARVSPDGKHLAFMSQRSLTGYDNRDANSAKRDEEVYEFNAETGRLICASCDPTGARPVGVEYKQLELEGGLVAGFKVWSSSTWLAANVPGWTQYGTSDALYQSRYLSDSGRLFFNSSDALSPQDVNGTEDVYEFEPPGIGTCTSVAASYSERSGGCVALISSGTSREESAFLDASEDGSSVFFLTLAKLAKQDFDRAADIYDARECTGASPCLSEPVEAAPPCVTEASCKAAPTPQPEIFGAPPSATFSGLGNIAPPAPVTKPKPKAKTPTRAQKLTKALEACRGRYRHAKKKRAACERQSRKLYAAKASRKTTGRSGS